MTHETSCYGLSVTSVASLLQLPVIVNQEAGFTYSFLDSSSTQLTSAAVYRGGSPGSANGNASFVAPHSSPGPFTKVTESFTKQKAARILT